MRPRAPHSVFQRLSSFPPLIVQLLFNRGLAEPEEAAAFFRADASLLHDPLLLPDMSAAVARLLRAIAQREPIAVFGDFDVDGVTGTAILTEAIGALGGSTIPYLPHREREGHGLNLGAVEGLRGRGARLLVTVDCGVSSKREIEAAQRLGMETIVVDHHVVPSTPPPAVAVVDPKGPGSRYPYEHLTGAGLAFKLAQALCQARGAVLGAEALELAALGTVADIASLVGENRYLVKAGLASLRTTKRPGLQALFALAGLRPELIDAEAISYAIAPRLNAAGRMEHALTSLRLLTSGDPQEAKALAAALERWNQQRQQLTKQCFQRAQEMVEMEGPLPFLLFVGDRDFPPGIVGLVASKLVERYGRPAVAFSQGSGFSRGSCRSIPQFNVVAALQQHQELLAQFGGHPQAAGFTVANRHLPRLRQVLHDLAQSQLQGMDLQPSLSVDALVRLSTLEGEVLRCLQDMAPHGMDNPPPVFLSRTLEVLEVRPLGERGEHLRLRLKADGSVWEGVWFAQGEERSWTPGRGDRVDAVYHLAVDRWTGEPLLRLVLLDLRPARSSLGGPVLPG